MVLSSNISSSELRAEYYNQPLIKKEQVLLRYFLSDGAGAIVLQASEEESGLFVENAYMESVGGKEPAGMLNKRPAYWMNPKEEFEKGFHHLSQMFNEQLGAHFIEEGGSIFYKGLQRMIKKYKVDVNQIRFFQINFPSKHISEMVLEECESLGISKNTLYTKISSMGYVGPPMVFICIDKIMREEQLNKNDLILSFVSEVSKFMQAGFTLKKY